MTHPRVDALIQGAGNGQRMGGQPKSFIHLGSETVLERCVRVMLAVADRVVVAVPAGEVKRAIGMLTQERVQVIAGGATRTETSRCLIETSDAEWIILQDVAHPFVTVDLARRVLAAARQHGAAVAGIPLVEYIYDAEGRVVAAPNELFVSQKPVAARRDAFLDGFRRLDAGAIPEHGIEFSAPGLLALAGLATELVRGDRRNIKLTFQEDLELARLLLEHDPELASIDHEG